MDSFTSVFARRAIVKLWKKEGWYCKAIATFRCFDCVAMFLGKHLPESDTVIVNPMIAIAIASTATLELSSSQVLGWHKPSGNMPSNTGAISCESFPKWEAKCGCHNNKEFNRNHALSLDLKRSLSLWLAKEPKAIKGWWWDHRYWSYGCFWRYVSK